jgi:hypothetical protein
MTMRPLSLHLLPGLGWLLLEGQRRPADSFPLKSDIHFDAVGDRNEGNAFIHLVLAVERHCAFNFA